ncbi:Ribonuclease P protein component 3 [Dorcoceras hygrometricum]|nr:Ribonuclease P protein component 3 [Dorcoceras hygrometricum]
MSFRTSFQLMYILQSCSPPPQTLHPSIFCRTFLSSNLPIHYNRASILCSHGTRLRAKNLQTEIEMNDFSGDQDAEAEDDDGDKDEFPWSRGGFSGREDEGQDYDKDPEFAEIIGSYLDNPEKARSKLEERLRRKKNKILQTKTGSAKALQVEFNKFDFSNSYIWLEFYNTPLDKDISLIRDTIRSWHIIGRLGGCNSMNMQLSQSPTEKRPSYDAIQGANVTPTAFYNIGDLEIQDNLARIWVDIGTSEPLLLDILINALTQISSDYIGIKKVMFGGTEFGTWSENLTTEEAGYTIHKI